MLTIDMDETLHDVHVEVKPRLNPEFDSVGSQMWFFNSQRCLENAKRHHVLTVRGNDKAEKAEVTACRLSRATQAESVAGQRWRLDEYNMITSELNGKVLAVKPNGCCLHMVNPRSGKDAQEWLLVPTGIKRSAVRRKQTLGAFGHGKAHINRKGGK